MKLACRIITVLAMISLSIRAMQQESMHAVEGPLSLTQNQNHLFALKDTQISREAINQFFTKEKTCGGISNAIYHPVCATVGNGNDTKKINIVLCNVFDPDSECTTYISWSTNNAHTNQCTETARYTPRPSIQYQIIRANSDGTLVAAGYGNNKSHCVNAIDILNASENEPIEKVLSIVLPPKMGGSEGIMNMQLDDTDRLLIRTQKALYACDIHGILKSKPESSDAKKADHSHDITTYIANNLQEQESLYLKQEKREVYTSKLCGRPLYLVASLATVSALCTLLSQIEN